jgi:hypothetical protein
VTGVLLRQRSAFGHICLQGGSRQQLHDQKGHVPVGTVVEDGHDVGMLQPGRILRFPLKPFESNLVAGWIELLHLNRQIPAQLSVMGRPDLTQPASPIGRSSR